MHETLSGVLPSQAEMELDVIGSANVTVTDGQDFIGQMVDYRAGYGISNRLLRDLSQANEVCIAFLFVCVQNYPLIFLTQTVCGCRMKFLIISANIQKNVINIICILEIIVII
jgi:hypothetical protein